jgi:AraC-like DNA-binding protein
VKIDFYNDSIDQGESEIIRELVTDSVVDMRFILKSGFMRPYVGVMFQSVDNNLINISSFNMVRVEMSGQEIKPVFLYLVFKDSSENFEGIKPGTRHLCKYIEIDKLRQEYNISFSDFYTPDWWFDKYNLSPSTVKPPQLNRLLNVSIATGLTPSLNQERSLQIYSIVFYRDNRNVVIIMVLIQILIIVILFVIYLFNNKPKNEPEPITINYNPVNVDKKPNKKDDFLDYINNNFNNSELSLLLISEQTGISQRKITETISHKFNCNVKTYINQIRISEAQRLLKETDLNISEIGYTVGFSSPSNFNRVFKNFTGKSPSEFLQSIER